MNSVTIDGVNADTLIAVYAVEFDSDTAEWVAVVEPNVVADINELLGARDTHVVNWRIRQLDTDDLNKPDATKYADAIIKHVAQLGGFT
jgi:hypothetical protein